MAESEEKLKSLLMRGKEESEKAGFKLNTEKTKIMASDRTITSCQIEEGKVEGVTDFTFLGSQITADVDCSHEIKILAPHKEIYDKSSVSCWVMYDFCDPMDCSQPGSSVHEILQ